LPLACSLLPLVKLASFLGLERLEDVDRKGWAAHTLRHLPSPRLLQQGTEYSVPIVLRQPIRKQEIGLRDIPALVVPRSLALLALPSFLLLSCAVVGNGPVSYP
jgi:hypothetical protein